MVYAGQVNVEPINESTGASGRTDLKTHVTRPTAPGGGPVVRDGQPQQVPIKRKVDGARLGSTQVEIVDETGVTRIFRNRITTPRRWRGRNNLEIGLTNSVDSLMQTDRTPTTSPSTRYTIQLGLSCRSITEAWSLTTISRVIRCRTASFSTAPDVDTCRDLWHEANWPMCASTTLEVS